MWVDKYSKESADQRFQKSAYRLLLNVFRVGLFEIPYLDPAETTAIVGCPEYMEAGYDVQQKSVVMLKNHKQTLPVAEKKNVYVPKRHFVKSMGFFGPTGEDKWDYPISLDLVKKYYNGVKSPSEFADNVLRPRKLKPDANIIQDLIDKL
jgi:beta-glucosidase